MQFKITQNNITYTITFNESSLTIPILKIEIPIATSSENIPNGYKEEIINKETKVYQYDQHNENLENFLDLKKFDSFEVLLAEKWMKLTGDYREDAYQPIRSFLEKLKNKSESNFSPWDAYKKTQTSDEPEVFEVLQPLETRSKKRRILAFVLFIFISLFLVALTIFTAGAAIATFIPSATVFIAAVSTITGLGVTSLIGIPSFVTLSFIALMSFFGLICSSMGTSYIGNLRHKDTLIKNDISKAFSLEESTDEERSIFDDMSYGFRKFPQEKIVEAHPHLAGRSNPELDEKKDDILIPDIN